MRVGGRFGLAGALAAGVLAAASLPSAAPPAVMAPELASAYRAYSVKLHSYVPMPGRAAGLSIAARVDGGPTLHLLLDSGTQQIVLNRAAAARSGHAAGADFQLVGAGAAAGTAKLGGSAEVETGGLVLRHCPLLIAGRPLAEGIDGVMPLSLFAGFLVRLDGRGKTLDLLPFSAEPASAPGEFIPAVANNDLLFLKAELNGAAEGYVLLDTGASYNAISTQAAERLKNYSLLSPLVALRGGLGPTMATALPFAVRFRSGGWEMRAPEVVALDLSAMARYHKLPVARLIGYPALAASVLTVDYRQALVRIESQ